MEEDLCVSPASVPAGIHRCVQLNRPVSTLTREDRRILLHILLWQFVFFGGVLWEQYLAWLQKVWQQLDRENS